MTETIRFEDSVEEGDLDYIKDLRDTGAIIKFKSPVQLKEWVETVDQKSNEWTYYYQGDSRGITNWRMQCMAAERE